MAQQPSSRTAWHVLFVQLVSERGPPQVAVRSEVVLTTEPQRADLLLLQRQEMPRQDEKATVLRGLWPRLTRDTLVEYKSKIHPLQLGDWSRLLGYGAREDADALGIELVRLQPGYLRVDGLPFPAYLVVLVEVADAEQDDLIRWFARSTMTRDETRWWVMAHATNKDGTTKLSEREGYRELLQSLLAGLAPEERLAGLGPEERLAGLAPDESVLALPDEILARLAPDFVATLPERVQSRIRQRLATRQA